MPLPIIIAISAVAAVVVILVLIWLVRIIVFRPTADKAKQLKELNDDLEPAGFAYNMKEDYFYSLKNCWQREAGYCRLYDEGSPFFNMIMDCEPITFSYGGKRWLIELWKGQYGITTGAEIGIYNTMREDIHSEKFTGTFYEPISDAEQMDLSFVLRKNGKVLLKRKGLHWWLTAFKLGEFSETNTLTMEAKIKFPNRAMCWAFVNGLMRTGYRPQEFSIHFKTVTIYFDKPHSPQPVTQEGIQEDVVQGVNKNNCKLYNTVTARYTDTLDKLEYLKAFAPELYEIMMHSLYAKGFFSAFEWIIKIIHGHRPPNPPEPPKPPCPPCPNPCPPCPPQCRPCCPCPPKPPCPPPKPPCPPTETCTESQPADAETLRRINSRQKAPGAHENSGHDNEV